MNSKKTAKRILVLTLQPLGLNYGGTIQAYALQKTLSGLGYEVATHNEKNQRLQLNEFIDAFKYFISNNTIKRGASIKRYHIPKSILTKYTKSFVEDNIVTDTKGMGNINSAHRLAAEYDAIVVGSDQVWRKDYVNIAKYLLDFTAGMNIVRISYAASFGKDDISDYGDELIQTSKRLANSFDAISVRESSAVDICKKYWEMDATQVLDPTMLLQKEDYVILIESYENATDKKDSIFSYVLDETVLTSRINKVIEEQLSLDTYGITPPLPNNYWELLKNQNSYAWPSVAKWLGGFYSSGFVVTDSFHGTVFAIIFNKPFIAIGNKERGMARFLSLLETFGLESRLVSDASEVTADLLNEPIDWDKVNQKLKSEQKRSLEYLKLNLGKNARYS